MKAKEILLKQLLEAEEEYEVTKDKKIKSYIKKINKLLKSLEEK